MDAILSKHSNSNIFKSTSELIINNKPFPYPACWQNEERVQVLFSKFRPRNVNRENYDSKMKFWHEMIAEYCRHSGKATFCIDEIKLMFTKGDRAAACLDTVLLDMHRLKKILLRSEYDYNLDKSWGGWVVRSFIRKPFLWGWNTVQTLIGFNEQTKKSWEEWVHLEIVNEICNDLLLNLLENHSGKIMHFETFKSAVKEFSQKTDDFLQLCLHTLCCNSKIGLEYKDANLRQIYLIKVPGKFDPSIAINDSDHAVYNLQITRTNLLHQLETLEKDINDNEDKARQNIKGKKYQLAKTYMHKKLLLESSHKKCGFAIHNIEVLLCSIEEAQKNGEIISAYKSGSKALQNILIKSGLKFENIEEVLDDVRDILDQHTELQNIISNVESNEPSFNSSKTKNHELERELRNMAVEKRNIAKYNMNSHKEDVTDEKLLKMIQGLDVVNNSPIKSTITRNAIPNI